MSPSWRESAYVGTESDTPRLIEAGFCEAGSYLRLIDLVYHSRVIKKIAEAYVGTERATPRLLDAGFCLERRFSREHDGSVGAVDASGLRVKQGAPRELGERDTPRLTDAAFCVVRLEVILPKGFGFKKDGSGGVVPEYHVQRFRYGLVFKAHRLRVSLNSSLESNEEKEVPEYRRSRRARLPEALLGAPAEREFFIHNLLVRIHFIIVMIRWTGGGCVAPWRAAGALHVESGPLRAVHLPRHKWPGGLVNTCAREDLL